MGFLSISGGTEVNQVVQIRLKVEAKFGGDPYEENKNILRFVHCWKKKTISLNSIFLVLIKKEYMVAIDFQLSIFARTFPCISAMLFNSFFHKDVWQLPETPCSLKPCFS